MNTRKIVAVLACVILTLAMAGAALAETVSPNPVKIDVLDLGGRYVTANIEYKGEGVAALTLVENEQFEAEAVRALQAGDVLLSNGEEIAVETVEWDGPDLWINRGTEQEVLLCEAGHDKFERVMWDDMVPQVTIGTVECEILPYIVMLDHVDAKSGELLEKPVVRDGEELLGLLESGDGPSFAVENVHVLFDDNNQPMLVWRFYSPAR